MIFERAGSGTAADFERPRAMARSLGELDPERADARGLPVSGHLRAVAQGRRGAARCARWSSASSQPSAMDLRAEAAARKLSLREVVTLASLIEKETGRADERPIVSAVYHNRLKIGMPLQCDPTVIYALMLARRWNGNLTRQDLQMNSPYNTYRYRGIAAGPDRVARPRVARGRRPARRRAVPLLRQPQRRHARVRHDARRTQPERARVAGQVLSEARSMH